MQINQIQEEDKLRRDRVREAVALAVQGRWHEALAVNQALLAQYPGTVDTLNRLGKALSELGRYAEAREAFQQALDHSPSNGIARKNLERLERLKDTTPAPRAERLSPQLFIEESGKSCVTMLRALAAPEVLARVAAGDPLDLQVDGATVRVVIGEDAHLGQLEPKLAARLIKLIEAGNRYRVAVAAMNKTGVSVILREVYQHPRLAGIVSFPTRMGAILPYAPVVIEEELDSDEEEDMTAQWSGTDGDSTPLLSDEAVGVTRQESEGQKQGEGQEEG